jgi:hypothetical protein
MNDLDTMLKNAVPGWRNQADRLAEEAERIRAEPESRTYAAAGDTFRAQMRAEAARKAEAIEERVAELEARSEVAEKMGLLLVSRQSRAAMGMDADPTLRTIFAAAAKLNRIRYTEPERAPGSLV